MYLHGWADTGSTFQFVVDTLCSEWRVVAPDWRGFGRSSCRCTSYWFPDYLADLHALLDIYSANEPVRLIGHSMGANVGSLYAGTMPERVRAFVNVEGFGLPDSDPGNAPGRYRAWIEQSTGAPGFSEYPDLEALAARLACRAAIMAGDVVEPPEAIRLLDDLARVRDPYTCPHGRPVWIRLGREERERKFGRR